MAGVQYCDSDCCRIHVPCGCNFYHVQLGSHEAQEVEEGNMIFLSFITIFLCSIIFYYNFFILVVWNCLLIYLVFTACAVVGLGRKEGPDIRAGG